MEGVFLFLVTLLFVDGFFYFDLDIIEHYIYFGECYVVQNGRFDAVSC